MFPSGVAVRAQQALCGAPAVDLGAAGNESNCPIPPRQLRYSRIQRTEQRNLYQKHAWGTTALQWTFSIVIATETFLAMPLGGYLVDRSSPKWACIGGPLIAIGWYFDSIADALYLFYFAAVIIGADTGLVFAAAYGNAPKWFPDKRGFALGLTAFGFAAGGVLTVVPLDSMIKTSGYEAAYQWFGIGQGIVVFVSGLLLRAPLQGEVTASASARVSQGKRDYAFLEMLRSPPFWLMYVMFALVGAGGLMLQAQLAPIARDFAIDKVPVTILGLTMLTPIFAVLRAFRKRFMARIG
jgi:OFA family oxalate/formate antiporter-like MFS transporter